MKYLTSVLTESLPSSTPSPSAVLERVGGRVEWRRVFANLLLGFAKI
jgi:hypothetical protein